MIYHLLTYVNTNDKYLSGPSPRIVILGEYETLKEVFRHDKSTERPPSTQWPNKEFRSGNGHDSRGLIFSVVCKKCYLLPKAAASEALYTISFLLSTLRLMRKQFAIHEIQIKIFFGKLTNLYLIFH